MGKWKNIYLLVKRTPKGRVVSYGAVARVLHVPGGARTVGRAMAACPKGYGIPWHRVLGAGGRILVREPMSNLQRRLLESEGVEFIAPARANMRRHEWNPPAARAPKRPPKRSSASKT